jgi:hypothetical protein
MEASIVSKIDPLVISIKVLNHYFSWSVILRPPFWSYKCCPSKCWHKMKANQVYTRSKIMIQPLQSIDPWSVLLSANHHSIYQRSIWSCRQVESCPSKCCNTLRPTKQNVVVNNGIINQWSDFQSSNGNNQLSLSIDYSIVKWNQLSVTYWSIYKYDLLNLARFQIINWQRNRKRDFTYFCSVVQYLSPSI